ncbi:MAG TPA: hypothetical protein VFY05_13525, partial [Candidatus Angelobacter sp.]|nr:hypothetical protein [Candidatus Angelobacter sp.]
FMYGKLEVSCALAGPATNNRLKATTANIMFSKYLICSPQDFWNKTLGIAAPERQRGQFPFIGPALAASAK